MTVEHPGLRRAAFLADHAHLKRFASEFFAGNRLKSIITLRNAIKLTASDTRIGHVRAACSILYVYMLFRPVLKCFSHGSLRMFSVN
jgi:hypothetical protein